MWLAEHPIVQWCQLFVDASLLLFHNEPSQCIVYIDNVPLSHLMALPQPPIPLLDQTSQLIAALPKQIVTLPK